MPKGSYIRHAVILLLCLGALALLAIVSSTCVVGEGTVLVDLGDDVTTQEDKQNTFTPWVSYTGTKGLQYAWDFGDGSTSSVERPTHAYTLSGNYTVTLTVTDGDGVHDSDTLQAEVLNVRPIADAGANRSTVEGTSVTFDGTGSWDTSSDLPLLTYEWDFGDGSLGTGTSKENKVVTHTYQEPGVYIVRLVVRDDDWQSSNYAYVESQLIEVTEAASGNGSVNFWFDMGTVNSSQGNSSSSGGAFPYEFYWEFGDGSSSQGQSASHTYSADGTYIVTLIITDALGAMSTHSVLVTVLNSPPTAGAGPDRTAQEDEVIAFDGQGSDPGGGEVTFAWDFGDGSTAQGQNVTHYYTRQGTYTVALTVTDSDDDTATDTCSVTVNNVPPTAGLTSNHTTEEGDVIGFYGSTSTDTPSDIPTLTYSWDFGDGGTATGIEVSHAYVDEGTYTVTLTVTDDDSAVDTMTMTVPVDNAAPSASIDSISPAVADEDQTVTFQGSATDPGTSDVLSYSWDFGDGSTATGTEVTHSYSTSGIYTVTLTVTDGDGGVGADTGSVRVDGPVADAMDMKADVQDAPDSYFNNANDKKNIDKKLDKLIGYLKAGKYKKAEKVIDQLEDKIEKKVTNEDFQEQLEEQLEEIEDAID